MATSNQYLNQFQSIYGGSSQPNQYGMEQNARNILGNHNFNQDSLPTNQSSNIFSSLFSNSPSNSTTGSFGQFIQQSFDPVGSVAGAYGNFISAAAPAEGFEYKDGSVNSSTYNSAGFGRGVANGAKIGGTIGSVIPGVGTVLGSAAGSIIGGISGYLSGNKDAKRASMLYNKSNDSANANGTLMANQYNNSLLEDQAVANINKYKNGGVAYGTFDNGGHSVNAMVDNNEIIQSPQGNVLQAIGPSATDKILAKLQPGSKILSDTMQFGGKTYAELGKNIPVVQNKSNKILSDPNASPLDKSTAKLNIKNSNSAFDHIMDIQEDHRISDNLNKFKKGIQKYSCGGTKKYADGGVYGAYNQNYSDAYSKQAYNMERELNGTIGAADSTYNPNATPSVRMDPMSFTFSMNKSGATGSQPIDIYKAFPNRESANQWYLQNQNEFRNGRSVHLPQGIAKYADGGTYPEDDMLNSIYSEYPGFRSVDKPVLKADKTFTRDYTGTGDIETFVPYPGGDNSKITYRNGNSVLNPNKDGGFGIVYNPDTNGRDNIALDMMHLMHSDKNYEKLWNSFADEYEKTDLGDNPALTWKNMSKKDRDNIESTDGYNQFRSNMMDGNIRTLMLGDNKDLISKYRYDPDLMNRVKSNQALNDKWNAIYKYIKTAPEVKKYSNGTPGALYDQFGIDKYFSQPQQALSNTPIPYMTPEQLQTQLTSGQVSGQDGGQVYSRTAMSRFNPQAMYANKYTTMWNNLSDEQKQRTADFVYGNQDRYVYNNQPTAEGMISYMSSPSTWNKYKIQSHDNTPANLADAAFQLGYFNGNTGNNSNSATITPGAVQDELTMQENAPSGYPTSQSVPTTQDGTVNATGIYNNAMNMTGSGVNVNPYSRYYNNNSNTNTPQSNVVSPGLRNALGTLADYGSRALDLAPYFYNMGRSKEGVEQINAENFTNRGRAIPDTYNPYPELRENRTQAAIARTQNAMTNSGGADMAFASYIAKQKADMDSSVWNKKNQYDNNQRSAVQSTNLQLESQNNQIRQAINDTNMRSRAKSNDFKAKAMQQLSEWNQRNRLDSNVKNNDNFTANTYAQSLNRYLTPKEYAAFQEYSNNNGLSISNPVNGIPVATKTTTTTTVPYKYKYKTTKKTKNG